VDRFSGTGDFYAFIDLLERDSRPLQAFLRMRTGATILGTTSPGALAQNFLVNSASN